MELTVPDSWLSLELGAVVDYGKTSKAEPSEIPDDGWILELEDIEKDTSKVLERRNFAERQSKSTKSRFKRGDVLYGKLRPYLNKVTYADADGFCTTEIIPISGNTALDARYLFHWMKHPAFLEYVNAVSHGLSMPRLGTDAGKKAPFVLAPKAEQKRIADKLDTLLSRVDACRKRLDRVPTLIKRFKQSVLAAATSGELTADWRESKHKGWEWEEKTIEQVAHVGTGSTPLRSNPDFFSTKGTPWITSSATSKELVLSAEEYVTKMAVEAHRLKTYPIGTLLVAMYGEGKTRGQVTELGIPATINQACAAVVVDESLALRGFVKLSLQGQYLAMREMATGGNQPNLNLSKIKEFSIAVPQLDEQAEVLRRVNVMFNLLERLESRLSKARQQAERLTPSLLAKAFRGELVPQDPNDEPAQKMLERLNTAKSREPLKATSRGRKRTATT